MQQYFPNDILPSRLVAALQFIGRDGKPMGRARQGGQIMYPGDTNVARESGGFGFTGPIRAFRFLIAVNPRLRKIPVEFEHIPLPKP
jgi:hypothetical protein